MFRFWRASAERGAVSAEMALLLGLVAMGAVAALSTMGNTIGGSEQANTASGALGGSSEPSLIETTSGRLWDPSSGAVVSLGGGTVRATTPGDTLQGNAESDKDPSRIWPEAGPIVLDQDVKVISIDGTFDGSSPHNQVIPAGTQVCSYYVQIDRATNGYASGSADFRDREVLGVVASKTELKNTDDVLGEDSTYYGGFRGLESNDKVTIDNANNTVSWSIGMLGQTYTDDFRIVTSC